MSNIMRPPINHGSGLPAIVQNLEARLRAAASILKDALSDKAKAEAKASALETGIQRIKADASENARLINALKADNKALARAEARAVRAVERSVKAAEAQGASLGKLLLMAACHGRQCFLCGRALDMVREVPLSEAVAKYIVDHHQDNELVTYPHYVDVEDGMTHVQRLVDRSRMALAKCRTDEMP